VRLPASTFTRASIVFILSFTFLSSVFQVFHRSFWTGGIGDWMDPHFINFLLEHWYHSLRTFTDPSSPPMFFPVRGTLGYSHGLVLYVPFYVLVRPFFHPFQAYGLTLFAVIETGVLCLYLVFRRVLGLSFVESLLLSGWFLTSPNVANGMMGVWSQRASVFLIPPILLIVVSSIRMRPGASRMLLAAVAGLLSALLFTQDFYTAQFALFFTTAGFAAALRPATAWQLRSRVARLWASRPSAAARAALVLGAVALVWTAALWIFGGFTLRVLGVRIASHDWQRPALLALASLVVLAWLHDVSFRPPLTRARPWLLPFAAGGAVGSLVFLWIYLPVYREHHAFPEDQLLNALVRPDSSSWHGVADVVRGLSGYDSLWSFALVALCAALAWVPRFDLDRRTRRQALWCVSVSLVVLMVPLQFPGFSLWKTAFAPVTGFSVIRDPKRIIYLYELAVVLAAGVFLARLRAASVLRRSIPAILLAVMVAQPNRVVFETFRPNESHNRRVAAPIDIAPSCRSFFVRAGSEAYRAESNGMWLRHAIDSMYVSLAHSIPTLNGYSAWSPDGWALVNPEEPGYRQEVSRWIERHRLTGVCEFDIDRRTMVLYHPEP